MSKKRKIHWRTKQLLALEVPAVLFKDTGELKYEKRMRKDKKE